jgi:citrate/tricarballylate utilization protein
MPEISQLLPEAERQLTICNACRYCEGFCPVFPAIEIRRDFKQGDVFFLSNLCHDCRACYYACMYTPPHEFAINLPGILAESRLESYRAWSWPSWFGRSFTNWQIGALIATAAASLVAAAAAVFISPSKFTSAHHGPGAFYEVIPFQAMLFPAFAVALYAGLVFLIGAVRFWVETAEHSAKGGMWLSLRRSVADILGLRWMRGGGPGCFYPKQTPSSARRIAHSLIFFGFLAAFISTTLAAIYQHFLDWFPPYPATSAPVLFGTVGGVAMIAGVCGMLTLKSKSDREPADKQAMSIDYLFLILLGLASLTGILTLIFRSTSAMAILLVIHLATVAGLFITMPYGKFVHAIYRSLAVLRHNLEQSSKH